MADLGYDANFLETTLAPPQAPDVGKVPTAGGAELEALLDDLRTDGARLGGLPSKTQRYLADWLASSQICTRIEGDVRLLAERRNQYAHSLDGSPWGPAGHDFDLADCDAVFGLVGRLAVDMIRLRDAT